MANNLVAYGFISLQDLFSQRIVTIAAPTIQTAVEQSLAEHSRQVKALMSALVQETPNFKYRFQLPAGGSLQPMDPRGNPLVVQPTGFYDVAFPIQWAGTAWGTDRASRAMATVEDLNRFTVDQMDRDADWMRRHMLNALFSNAAWTYTDERYGALTIQPLANNDGTGYVLRGGQFDTTQNHFLSQAAAISDANNPFPTIYRALDEHPSNSGPYVVYVATNLAATIQAMTSTQLVTMNNLIYGVNITRDPVAVNPDDTLRGAGIDINFGDRYLGLNSNCHIVEWTSLPSNYMVAHATGVDNVIGMRQYEAAELQGLYTETFSPDGNLQEIRYIRTCGFGIINRIGALLYGPIGSASYTVPAGYVAGIMPA